jgi:hypothetical protein
MKLVILLRMRKLQHSIGLRGISDANINTMTPRHRAESLYCPYVQINAQQITSRLLTGYGLERVDLVLTLRADSPVPSQCRERTTASELFWDTSIMCRAGGDSGLWMGYVPCLANVGRGRLRPNSSGIPASCVGLVVTHACGWDTSRAQPMSREDDCVRTLLGYQHRVSGWW